MTPSFNFQQPVLWHIPLTVPKEPVERPSQERRIAAVANFSAYLFNQAELRQYPEIIALAFWFRAANLRTIVNASDPMQRNKQVNRVFHIAPANVDTVFLYSVLLSVLSGNQNIVRVSERSGDTTWLLIEALNAYLNTAAGLAIKPLISVIQYAAEFDMVTEQLSQWCDLRVLWGGDNAIKAISSIAPETPQICFPDRYSIAVLALSETTSMPQVAKAFLTDLLPFNQQACSSPKALYWVNTELHLQQAFWNAVAQVLPGMSHQLDISNKVEQHILLQLLAARYGLKCELTTGNPATLMTSVEQVGPVGHCRVKLLTPAMLAAHTGNGLVLEATISDMADIAYSDKLQTVTFYTGDEELVLAGDVKRKVAMGKALEFNVVWDGVDLVQVFSQ